MLDGLAADRLQPELFVHFVKRLHWIRDQQLGTPRENKQSRRVRHHLDQALALVSRVDHHPTEFEYFRREHPLEQRRRIQMTERQRRVREASRPERANQRRASSFAALAHIVEAKMNRE